MRNEFGKPGSSWLSNEFFKDPSASFLNLAPLTRLFRQGEYRVHALRILAMQFIFMIDT